MFSIIVACDKQGGIGKDNELPWNLKGDMKHFSKTTKKNDNEGVKNVVIMGRKTYESIPEKFRPLPGRINVVITRNKDYKAPEGGFVAHSLDEALELPFHGLSGRPASKFFVIGGAEIYKQAFIHKGLSEIYLTHIDAEYKCDTFIELDCLKLFSKVEEESVTENDTNYKIQRYTKFY